MLNAAAQLMIEQGTGTSLAKIAEAAGVSKSGMLHHFPSREAIVLAVVIDANERFRAAVLQHLDLSENYSGKMARAYIRALCDTSQASEFFASTAFWAGLEAEPEAMKIIRDDSAWWREQLVVDGLDPELAHIVQRAAEGLAVAYSYGDESDESIRRARDRLLAMTRE